MRLTLFGLQGLAFYVVILGAFYATPYSNPFFLLLGFLTLLGASSLLSTRRNVRDVTLELGEFKPVVSGAEVRVPARVTADGRPRFGITVKIELEGGQILEGRVDLLEGQANLAVQGPPMPRGAYAAKRAWVESTHPAGLFRAMTDIAPPTPLLVYPAPTEYADGHSTSQTLGDLLGTSESVAGDLQPGGLRDHRQGDEVRAIHWRASARRGRLVIQEWEAGTAQGLEVVLDRRCESADLEQALSTISALVQLGHTNKETLRLHTQDLSANYGDGHLQWSEALRFLAEAQSLPANGPPPPAASPSVARLPRESSHV